MAADVTTQPVPSEDPQVVNTVVNVTDDPTNPTDSLTGLIQRVPAAVKESKEGYKTTEFWASLVASVLVVLDVVPADGSAEGVIVGLIAAVYALSRGIAKKGTPVVEPVAKDAE